MAPILDFTEAAVEYLDGADGAYEPFVYPGLDPAPKDANRKVETKTKAAVRALAQFSAFLERLTGIGTRAIGEALRSLTGASGTSGTTPVPGRELVVYTLGYGVLALLRTLVGPSGKAALALLNHWQLDRKLRDCFRDLGLNVDVSRRIVELMKALFGRTCAATVDTEAAATGADDAGKAMIIPEKPSAGAWAAALIAGNYQADDFCRILGVNRFNDITWFNKEAFEENLLYLSYFLLVEDGEALGPVFTAATGTAGRAAFIADFDRVMLKAEEKSGYRLDELIKALYGA